MKRIYQKKPRKIEMIEGRSYAKCENCGLTKEGDNVILLFNKTYHLCKKTNHIVKRLYANEDSLWLCKDCLNELREAIK